MSTKAKRPTYLLRVGMAHKRLFISGALGLVAMLVLPASLTDHANADRLGRRRADLSRGRCRGDDPVLLGRRNPEQRRGAGRRCASRILILSVAAAIASLGAIFAELATIERTNPSYGLYIALAIGTVVLSWTFTHTIFALHYAHEFYGEHARRRGLKFPDDGQPDYWDFIYFAFVIGMTFQVSDVAVTHKSMRRTVVAHGALSFFFTTAIVALTVNIAANVIQR